MTKLSKRTIAVTGYESFGSFDVNPSQVVVDNLAKKDFGDKVEVVCSSLPVAYRSAEECSSKLCKKNDVSVYYIVYLCLVCYPFGSNAVRKENSSRTTSKRRRLLLSGCAWRCSFKEQT